MPRVSAVQQTILGAAVLLALWLTPVMAGCRPGETGLAPGGRTTYRFAVPALQVPASLPTGTVMATARIPLRWAAPEEASCDAPVRETLWHAGVSRAVIQLATDLSGVDVRLVLEPAFPPDIPLQTGTGWNMWPSPSPRSQGGVRVELVKSGPMRRGRVSRVPDVQYRRTQGAGNVARREILHYGGQVRIDVVDSPQPSGRLS